MAYMRGDYYIWVSGGDEEEDWIHFNMANEEMPLVLFDQLVAMRWAEMTDAEREVAERAAVERFSGNIGCDKLCEKLGVLTMSEGLEKLMQRHTSD